MELYFYSTHDKIFPQNTLRLCVTLPLCVRSYFKINPLLLCSSTFNHRFDERHSSQSFFNSGKIKPFRLWFFTFQLSLHAQCKVAVVISKRFEITFRVPRRRARVVFGMIGQITSSCTPNLYWFVKPFYQ